jgi:mannosyl-3-phosphoglycerate phosphatase
MTPEEIAKETRLPVALAKLAKEREYDEPFRITPEKESSVLQAIATQGLCYTKGGRYYHLMGCNNNKGKAAKILTDMYKKEFHSILTIGVGDGPNDESMLAQVDKPFLIKNNEPVPVWKKILEIAQTHA